MKERDILRFEGPLGTFFLREDKRQTDRAARERHRFRSDQVDDRARVAHAAMTRPMALYWGARVRADLYMNELPEQWAPTHIISATCR